MAILEDVWLTGWRSMKSRKRYTQNAFQTGRLKRVLDRWDLTAMGVGASLGLGMYVIIGYVAKEIAGPSIVISFLLAGLAALCAGLCYCELAAMIPKAGSAFIYTYVCIGEFLAFLIGWCLILEYVIATASIAHGFSLVLDDFLGDFMSDIFRKIAPIDQNTLSSYFDFFALLVVIFVGMFLALALRTFAVLNKALLCVIIGMVIFIMLYGSYHANYLNWVLSPPTDYVAGVGGFFPYGFTGTVRGAAVCFYGYVGFESIAAAGEEALRPRRDIPFAILLTIWLAFVGYIIVSTIITMMVPYYMQSTFSAIPFAFDYVGLRWAHLPLLTGAFIGHCASFLGTMYPLPRVMFAMAREGLLFNFFGRLGIHRSPVIATFIATAVTAILSAILAMETMVLLMAMGTLMAYGIVSACVVLLRYRTDIQIIKPEIGTYAPSTPASSAQATPAAHGGATAAHGGATAAHGGATAAHGGATAAHGGTGSTPATTPPAPAVTPRMSRRSRTPPPIHVCERPSAAPCTCHTRKVTCRRVIRQMYGMGQSIKPTRFTADIVLWCLAAFVVVSALFGLAMAYLPFKIYPGILLASVAILLGIAIAFQPTNPAPATFSTPFSPIIPLLSVFIIANLMVALPFSTWLYFILWILFGIPFYFLCLYLYRGLIRYDIVQVPCCPAMAATLAQAQHLASIEDHSTIPPKGPKNRNPNICCSKVPNNQSKASTKPVGSNKSVASKKTEKSTKSTESSKSISQKENPGSRRGDGDYDDDASQINVEIIDDPQKNISKCYEKETQSTSTNNKEPEVSDYENLNSTDQINISIDVTSDKYPSVSAIIVNETQKNISGDLCYDSEKEDAIHKINGEIQIIEFLDQVLEAEEESYKNKNVSEIDDTNEICSISQTSELNLRAEENSDMESIESSYIPPTYDVIAIIHREDIPKVNAEIISETIKIEHISNNHDKYGNREIVKDWVDDSDETFHKNSMVEQFSEVENITEVSNMNFDYSNKILTQTLNNTDHISSGDVEKKLVKTISEVDGVTNDSKNLNIPIPPPMNEYLFGSPKFKRAHTIVAIPRRTNEDRTKDTESEDQQTRERTFSGSSYDDSVMVFGSDKQTHFMSKLNSMLQNKKVPPRLSSSKRSISTSHLTDMDIAHRKESDIPQMTRPKIMLDLKNELLSHCNKPQSELRPPEIKKEKAKPHFYAGDNAENSRDDSDEYAADNSLSREDLKSKLECIFAAGGGMLLKPRLATSNPPTPETVPQDFASEEVVSLPELSQLKEKTEKNDTLKMQRVKFGAVLDSFRNSMVRDSENF